MKVLLVQPSLSPPGGGNLVAAWMLQALRDEHALTLLAWEPPDLAVCNRHFGTSLRASDFRLRLVSPAIRRLGALTPTPLSLLKHGYLLRRAKVMAAEHDVVMTANNEADFGRRGIQYIHYPKLDLARPATDLRWYTRVPPVLAAYYRLCARLSGFSAERMRRNVTLVNSDYIGARVRALHGIEPITLHPPVPGDFPEVPWNDREDGFVCIGRFSPEKRIEQVVDILERVRAGGADVRLHLIGAADHRRYTRVVRRLAHERPAWVSLHENVARSDLVQLVARQRYGLHAMPDEHFGIAVAEMLRGGCIAFVAAGGGPVEVVGGDPRLLFTSPAEAARKILATLRDASLQAALRGHLARQAERFTTARFATRLREIVAQL